MPTINMKLTGMNIEKLRKAAGYSVKDLQDVFGFNSAVAIYKWQKGITLPSIDNLVILSYLFGVSLEQILAVDNTAMEKSA